MQISLVIPAHNEEAYLGGCLDSVLAHAAGRFHEIIVVDNASSDRTAEVARRRPGVRVVHEAAKGLTKARQRGFEEATGEYIAYIDADTRMPSNWLDIAERVFAANPDAVVLSGPGKYWDAPLMHRAILSAFWWATAPLSYRMIGYMVYGAHFIARRDAIAAIGGFNRSIEFYGEDTDLARRLSGVGKVIFRMDFCIYSSARRFKQEGILKTNLVYMLNFIWPAFFGRPLTRTHKDIRADV
jgi:glycosyltransferase involved in cell wall biosynthesis